MDITQQKRSMPEDKQHALETAVALIRSEPKLPIHFIILFGSYARGDWVEDCYEEDGRTYSYQSDFDLLVIVDPCPLNKQQVIEADLSHRLSANHKIPVSVNLLVHDIETVNRHFSQRQYFFSDIKREGKILYDSGQQKLAPLKKLNAKDRHRYAVEDFEYWFESANSFLLDYKNALDRHDYPKAAFELHQATERLYNGVLLVFTHYKPKTHDLDVLRRMVNSLDPRFLKAFPLASEEQKRLFTLLRKAYIDARYKKDYQITEEELKTLEQQVLSLQQLGQKLCDEKIAALHIAADKNGQ